jgi:hypothetical protein
MRSQRGKSRKAHCSHGTGSNEQIATCNGVLSGGVYSGFTLCSFPHAYAVSPILQYAVLLASFLLDKTIHAAYNA